MGGSDDKKPPTPRELRDKEVSTMAENKRSFQCYQSQAMEKPGVLKSVSMLEKPGELLKSASMLEKPGELLKSVSMLGKPGELLKSVSMLGKPGELLKSVSMLGKPSVLRKSVSMHPDVRRKSFSFCNVSPASHVTEHCATN
ncbi:hypothetical protein STEG23_032445 [Scotinomys teguina]